MTDYVTNFRKYIIKFWKDKIFDNGYYYYYRRYDIVIVTLSWTLGVCVWVCVRGCVCVSLFLSWIIDLFNMGSIVRTGHRQCNV